MARVLAALWYGSLLTLCVLLVWTLGYLAGDALVAATLPTRRWVVTIIAFVCILTAFALEDN